MTGGALALAVCLTLGAGDHPPAPVVSPDLRVHLMVSEDLDADALGALARPRAVLWLSTRSNGLRKTTTAQLRRFGEAWVQARPPLLPAQVETWRQAPAAGIWLREGVEAGDWIARLGVRRIAAEAEGDVPQALLGRRGLSRLRWSVAQVDLAAFGRIAFSGPPVTLALPPGTAPPACDGREPRLGRVTVRAANAKDAEGWAACGFRVRLAVAPELTDEALGALVRAVPLLELEVEVGADDRRAMAARRLLERLEPARP